MLFCSTLTLNSSGHSGGLAADLEGYFYGADQGVDLLCEAAEARRAPHIGCNVISVMILMMALLSNVEQRRGLQHLLTTTPQLHAAEPVML